MLLAGLSYAQMPGMRAEFVQVERATIGKDRVARKSIGHTEAINSITVRTLVEGYLVGVEIEEGATVKKGDILFRIDPLRYEAKVRQAEAAVREIEARIIYAQSQYDRLRELLASQAVSKEDCETALANLEELKAKKAGAEADLTKARKDLEDCTIRAEIDGVTGIFESSCGNYISAGQKLCTIKQMDPIYVRFPLSQADVNGIFRGPRAIRDIADVRLTTAAGRSYPVSGSIEIVDNLVTGSTDSYSLWAKFENAEGVLTPRGISALNIMLTDTAEVTMVPLTAVHHDSTGAYVYTVDSEGTVARREVIAGSIQGRLQSIYEGIEPGEIVIADGSHKTRPGAKVTGVFPEEQVSNNSINAPTEADETPIAVKMDEVVAISDPSVLTIQGARVTAIKRVDISPRVQGILTSHISEGSRVKEGDLLFSIDPTRYQAAVDAQESRVMQLQVRTEDARRKYKRQEELQKTRAASISEVESARATLQEMEAQLKSAEAALTIAKDDLSRCEMRAPINGRIGREAFSSGNYITNSSTALATLVQLSPIYVSFPLSEASVLSHFGNSADLVEQTEVTLITANGTTFPEKGRITVADNAIHAATGTQTFWATFENAQNKEQTHVLQPGATVTIKLSRKQDIKLPSVPLGVIQTDTGGRYVYVVRNNRAMKTYVKVGGANDDNRRVVFSGLKVGDKIITNNLAEMEDGTLVTEEQAAPAQSTEQ